MQTTITTIPALPIDRLATDSKKDLTARAEAFINEIVEKGGDVLHALALAAKLEHLVKEIKANAKDAGYRELSNYGKEILTLYGVELRCGETGVSYDYSSDPIWAAREAERLAVIEQQKQIETMLRSLPASGMGLTDPETGETYHAYPPARRASDSIVVKVK